MPFQFTVYYSTVYYCASAAYVTVSAFKFFLHIFLAFYPKFWHKVIQKGHFGLFTLFDFWTERYFKIPHFGSLFVLVHFVVFKCFTLRCFQIYIFYQFYFTFLQISPNFCFNCECAQISFSSQSNFCIKQSKFFLKCSPVKILLSCISVLRFLKLHFSPQVLKLHFSP